MSKETWLKKYYPIPADKMKRKTWMECLDHSILKWTGLLPSNLKRHGLEADDEGDPCEDGDWILIFSAGSCALCRKAEGIAKPKIAKCTYCVIYKKTGDICAEQFNKHSMGDPKPMLRLLRKVRKMK